MDRIEKKVAKRRLLEAASVLLEHADGKLQAVNLNKALFYLDLVALRDLGEEVTFHRFVALKNGPVVDDYRQRLSRELQRAGIAEQAEEGQAKPIRLRRPASISELSADEVELAPMIAAHFAALTAKAASQYSHENLGWVLAWQRHQADGRGYFAIDKIIAMQQICAEDPWVHEPLTDDEKAAVSSALKAPHLPW